MGRTQFQGTEAAKAPKTKPTVAAFGTCRGHRGWATWWRDLYTYFYIHIHIMIGLIMIYSDLSWSHLSIYLSIYLSIHIKLDLQGFTTSNVWFSNRLPTGMHPQVSAENPLLAQIHPRSLSLSKKGEPCWYLYVQKGLKSLHQTITVICPQLGSFSSKFPFIHTH